MIAVAGGLALVAGASSHAQRTGHASLQGVRARGPPTALIPGSAASPRPLASVAFEPNVGQTDSRVAYVARGGSSRLFLTRSEGVLTLRSPQSRRTASLRLSWPDANPAPSITATAPLTGYTNYFIGNRPEAWRTRIPNFGRVEYRELYPGIDLIFHGQAGTLEYDFVVRPGADAGRIRLAFEGADRMALEPGGDLVLHTRAGTVRQHKPVAYQLAGETRIAVGANYEWRGNRHLAIRLGPYNHARPLVIDPVIAYSTYLGGSDRDVATAVAVDADGNAYVTGETSSADFPVPPDAIQATPRGNSDVFITKLDPTGANVLFSTYLGGDSDERANAIAVGANGNVYIAGQTSEPVSVPFPTTVNAPFSVYLGGERDAFVSVVSGDGAQLLYSTYWGGTNNDNAFGIAVGADGAAYVAGGTSSADDFFIRNALQPGSGGGTDCFITKFDTTQLQSRFSSIVWSTFLGGSATERANAIAVDANDNVYVTGRTESPESDWLRATGFQTAFAGGRGPDAFVAVIDATGSSILYSTYLGGSNDDRGNAIAVDANGFVYVVGQTASLDFPTTPNAFQRAYGGGFNDAFVVMIDPSKSGDESLLYSTYLGGSGTGLAGSDVGNAVAVDPVGLVYVVGTTHALDFPVSADAFQQVLGGSADAFIAKLDPGQAGVASLVYASYLGGSAAEDGSGAATDGVGSVWIAGQTASTDLPVSPGVFQAVNAGGPTDAFVTRVADAPVAGAAPVKALPARENAAPANPPVQASIELQRGASAFRERRYADAAAHYRTVLALDPGQIKVALLLARSLRASYTSGDDAPANVATASEAIAAYEAVVRADPEQDEAFSSLITLYAAISDADNQRRLLSARAAASGVMAPRRAAAYRQLAELDLACARTARSTPGANECGERAAEEIDRGLRLAPNDYVLWVRKAEIARELAMRLALNGQPARAASYRTDADRAEQRVRELRAEERRQSESLPTY